ncbi:hypothetical protein [Plasmodium yoelii yoelii]|uniref:Uncharacterized protein n=1 Tax=Plasmodium yoelii yoelii TaxID=73239 RepID=Q7R8X5_PLAYO|nr:hypothetical protein [Plasmodium yoelii yoelii]
MLHNNLNAS